MNRSALLLLALLLVFAALGGGAVWLLGATGEANDPARATAGAAAPVAPTGTTAVPGATPGVAEVPTLAPGEQRASAEAGAGPDLGATVWVTGRVVLPAGTPVDEEAHVVALSFPAGRAGDAQQHRQRRAQLLLGGEDPTWSEVTCELAPDGSFRAPIDPQAESTWLTVEGRYVFMNELVRARPGAELPLLEPELGAWLVGRFELPAGAPADLVLGDPQGRFLATANGWSLGGRGGHSAAARVGADLTFELRGLPTDFNYMFTADPVELVAVRDMGLSLEAGVRLDRTWQLAFGARIAGRVVDEGGAPLAGARVSTRGQGAWFGMGRGRSDTADEEGRFELRGVRPGAVTVSAELEGYSRADSEERELADRETWSELLLTLPRGNRVTGTVAWPDGRPAPGVSVTAIEPIERGPRTGWVDYRESGDTTGADGRFEITGLGEGPFVLRAELEPEGEEVPGSWRAKAEEVQPGAELALVLSPPIGVAGRVVDDLGQPVTEFQLRVTEQREREAGSGNYSDETRSFEDEDGRFLLKDLAAGRWTLVADAKDHAASEPLEVVLPTEQTGLTLIAPRAGTIAGVVYDPSGAPVAGASVEAVVGASVEVRSARRVRVASTAAIADELGEFTLTELQPGAVTIGATHEEWAPGATETFDLAPGQVLSGAVLTLALGGRLTGEIFDAEGAPDAGRQIMVQTVGRGGSPGGTASSDGAGWFELDRLAPGSYQVMAFPEPDEMEAGDQAAMLASMRMTSTEIVEGETTHVTLGAPPADPVRLTGRVTQAGEPLPGVMVMALAEGGSMLEKMKVAQTGPGGEYEVTLDEPGDYMVMVGRQMGDDQGCEFHETIPAGPEYRLDLELPGGRIAGRVTGPDGKPVEGVRVSYEQEQGGLSIFSLGGMRTAQTDADGRYEFVNLRPGVYAVRAGSLRFFGGASRYGIAVRSGVVVTDGLTDGADLELSRPGSIAGTVLDEDGRPAAGASIFVRGVDGRLLNPFSTTETDGRGKFEFDGCAAGTYTVSARRDQAASPESAPVSVVEGEDAEVQLTLSSGTVLRVTVEDGEGKAVRASVQVYDQEGREVGSMLGTEAMEVLFTEGFSTTEQRIGPIPPGSYRVHALTPSGESAKKSVSLRGQEERRLRLRLK